MTVEVRRYDPSLREVWDAIVANSRNGLFLFDRSYMDYHSDRFEDFSAIAFVDGEAAAALPASIDRSTGQVTSHAGLTFGGIILDRDLRGPAAIRAINAILDALRNWGAQSLDVRVMPSFLTSYPSAETDYVLWRRGFELVRRDLSSALPLARAMSLNSSKKQAVAKARKSGVVVGEGSLEAFHGLLAEVLGWRHGVAPVHSLAELRQLADRFPEQILLRTATAPDGTLLAGVLVFVYPTAWHTQYMASSREGRKLGALDLVVATLLDEAREAGAEWLSLGTSTTDAGLTLNEGLLWQKESFGARAVTHDVMRGAL